MHVKASQPSAVEAAFQSEFTDLSKAWDSGSRGTRRTGYLGVESMQNMCESNVIKMLKGSQAKGESKKRSSMPKSKQASSFRHEATPPSTASVRRSLISQLTSRIALNRPS